MKVYEDRQDAGRRLAEELVDFANEKDFYIFALARGGVPVAFEVAKKFNCNLDVITVRKLGVPWHPEFAFGAIAPKGVEYIDQEIIEELNLSKEQIQEVKNKEKKEMRRRTKLYRGNLKYPDLSDKIALLIDDGIATGSTMIAAVKFTKTLNSKKIIIAVPVSAFDTASRLNKEVEEFICPNIPLKFSAVGQWYRKFEQTSDEKVIDLLKKNKKN